MFAKVYGAATLVSTLGWMFGKDRSEFGIDGASRCVGKGGKGASSHCALRNPGIQLRHERVTVDLAFADATIC